MPVLPVGCLRLTASTYRRAMVTTTMGNYLGNRSRTLRRHEQRPTHAHRRAGFGAAGRHPRGGGESRPVG